MPTNPSGHLTLNTTSAEASTAAIQQVGGVNGIREGLCVETPSCQNKELHLRVCRWRPWQSRPKKARYFALSMNEKPIPVANGSRFNRLGTTPEDIILISDLHLPVGHRDSIWAVLDAPFKMLIINGDLFDWRYINDLTAIDREIISKLENLEKQGRLIAIRGNNERLILGLSRFTSLRFVQEHVWLQQGKVLFATHGHQFVWFFDANNLKRNAVRFARKNNIDAIFVGHNQLPEIENENGILYANSGCFTGSCCSCLVLTTDLVVRLVQLGELQRK